MDPLNLISRVTVSMFFALVALMTIVSISVMTTYTDSVMLVLLGN